MSSQDGHPHIQSMSASGCLPKPWRGLAQNPQGHAQSFSLVGREAQLRSSPLLSGGQRNMTANTEETSCWSRGGMTQDRAGLVEHSEGQESLQDSSYQEMTFHQQKCSPQAGRLRRNGMDLWSHRGPTATHPAVDALRRLQTCLGFRLRWALAGYCSLLLAGWGQHPSWQVSLAQCEAGHPC